jgi:aminoglycoside phosphotransferase (APT) family kinase protein
MGREFTVLSKLKKHYSKVPTPIVYCETDEIIGAPFYIMERLKGVILRSANAPKLFILPDVYRKTSEALVDNLVELHGLDIRATGLAN